LVGAKGAPDHGAHGFGMVRQGFPSDRWIELLKDWLADKGFG
jgi:hypothetical protein